eukprot:scaffold2058_cov158-Alexandrium_tamarense.AAC.4
MAMSLMSRLLQFVGRKQKIKMCCFLLSSRDVCFDIQSLEIDPIASYRDSSLRRDSTRRRASNTVKLKRATRAESSSRHTISLINTAQCSNPNEPK